jgi:hypothetical protein
MPSDVGRPIPHIDQVAIDFPELVLVCGHIGYPWTEEMVAVATNHPNVYIDTSAYTVRRYPPNLVAYLRSHGASKVLFGTNWPMFAPRKALEGLDDLGLPSALAALGRRTRAQGSGPEGVVGCEGDRPLPQPVSSVLYRVAQEAVHNAVKHAGASAIRVSLTLGEDRATLEVADDGRGFSRDALGEGRGMGLFVMEERVVLVGGTFEVSSASGAGTRVRVEIPLTDEPAVLPALGGAA